MSQNVVYPGQEFVFAFHDDQLNLTGVYPTAPVTIDMPDGSQLTIPPPEIVTAPRDFVYAYDELGRRLDPRRFAGDGGTPLDPVAARSAPKRAIFSAPPARSIARPPGMPGMPASVAPSTLPPLPLPQPPPEPTPDSTT